MRRYVVRTNDRITTLAILDADLGEDGWDVADVLLPLVKHTAARVRITGQIEVVLMPNERHLCSWNFRNGQCEGGIQISAPRSAPRSPPPGERSEVALEHETGADE